MRPQRPHKKSEKHGKKSVPVLSNQESSPVAGPYLQSIPATARQQHNQAFVNAQKLRTDLVSRLKEMSKEPSQDILNIDMPPDIDPETKKTFTPNQLATIKDLDTQIGNLWTEYCKKFAEAPVVAESDAAESVAVAPVVKRVTFQLHFDKDLLRQENIALHGSFFEEKPNNQHINNIRNIKKQLDILEHKIKYFIKKMPENDRKTWRETRDSDNNYVKAARAARAIYMAIDPLVTEYEQRAINTDKFKERCVEAFRKNDSSIKELQKHRGFWKIMIDLIDAISKCNVHFLGGKKITDYKFFKRPTDAENIFNDLKKSIGNIDNSDSDKPSSSYFMS